MKAELKEILTVEHNNIDRAIGPTSEMPLFLRMMIGPKNAEGASSFDIQIVSTNWIKKELDRYPLLMGRHYIIMDNWNYDVLFDYINKYLEKCTGKDWSEVAEKVSRLGLSEFEDYTPYK